MSPGPKNIINLVDAGVFEVRLAAGMRPVPFWRSENWQTDLTSAERCARDFDVHSHRYPRSEPADPFWIAWFGFASKFGELPTSEIMAGGGLNLFIAGIGMIIPRPLFRSHPPPRRYQERCC